MNSDDLSGLLASTPAADTSLPTLGMHIGQVMTWDAASGTSQILVAGTVVENIPILTSAGIVSLEPGAPVAVIRYRSTYFVVGRIVGPGNGLVQPQTPVPLYPQFASNVVAGTTGTARVNSGVLATWEGRARPNLPYIEVDGIWGNLSGAGSTTYEVRLGGVAVGAWTSTTVEVARKGPFSCADRIGQDWLKVELAITASTGTGEKAIAPLGMYFRQK